MTIIKLQKKLAIVLEAARVINSNVEMEMWAVDKNRREREREREGFKALSVYEGQFCWKLEKKSALKAIVEEFKGYI